MTIRIRLTIMFAAITMSIVLLVSAVIYLGAQRNREQEFFELLHKEALTKANLFFDAKVDAEVLQEIYRSNREILNEVEVAIYDDQFELLYHDAVDIDFVKETPEMLNDIIERGKISFYESDWQVIGLLYEFQDKQYLITAAAFDAYGLNKLNSLFNNILFIFFVSIAIIFIAGLFLSKKAFEPIQEMNAKAKQISASNLDLRLNTANKKDELAELAATFNEMLSRLEDSFDAQKHFVTNISHELRTPLTAIIAELELATNRERNIGEYKTVIQNTLHDARKMVRLSNSILDLAKASYDPSEITFKEHRLDEIIWDARQKVTQANANYQVIIHFDENLIHEDTEVDLSFKGNEYLLGVACMNLMENGCKFSKNQTCEVYLSSDETDISLKFSDSGIGITKKELTNIFKPFYRGKNKKFTDGNGIGLYLTKKIVHLHNGEITVDSVVKTGTTFKIRLPKKKF